MGLPYIIKHYFTYGIIVILLYLYLFSGRRQSYEDYEEEPVSADHSELDMSPNYDLAKLKWAEAVIRNFTSESHKKGLQWSQFFHAIPHLRTVDPQQLQPVYLLPNKTSHRKLIIAIPAIQRPRESYLSRTLQSLTKWITKEDRENVTIMLFLSSEEGEESPFVKNTTAMVEEKFSQEVENGLIQVVMIPVVFYPPDLENLTPTFNDSKKRMYWRTKQNLDFLFMMMYGSYFGDYYLQMEDDVIASKGYIQNIFYFLEMKKNYPWAMMEFSSLGCIGKLIRTSDLYKYITVISLFYKNKPVDWIIDEYLRNIYCSPEWKGNKCYQEVSKFRLMYEPVQFQHIGMHSSLKGKIQKLKERSFGSNNLRRNRNNPPANLNTDISAKAMKFSLKNAYEKSAMFYGVQPKKGSIIEFKFKQPQNVTAILITTGNADKPEEQFSSETSVSSLVLGTLKEIGTFDENGRFFVKLKADPIDGVRITLNSDLKHDVILDQLAIST